MFSHEATLVTFAPLLCRLLRISLSAVSGLQMVCRFADEEPPLSLLLKPQGAQVRQGNLCLFVTYPAGVILHGSQWKRSSDIQRKVVCSQEEVGGVFLLLCHKLSRILAQRPHLKMREKVPYSMSTLPTPISFLVLLEWVVFLCGGRIVRCVDENATIMIDEVAVDIRLDTGACPFFINYPSLGVSQELIPDVPVSVSIVPGFTVDVSVDPLTLSMDCVVLYLVSHVQNTIWKPR